MGTSPTRQPKATAWAIIWESKTKSLELRRKGTRRSKAAE